MADAKKRKGGKVNPQLVLNAGLADHISRRQYDEAKLYEEAVPLAKKKVKAGTTVPGIALLKKAGISDEIISVVEAHDAPSYPLERVDTWEKKIAIYADYRTGQNVVSLEARLEDLKRLISDGRWTQEQYDECKNWIIGIEKEIFSNLDIKPGDITDSFPPQPRWERYLRRLYIEDAESGIFARLSLLYKELAEGKIDKAKLEEEFPDNTWWGRYARELYEKQKGIPYEPTHVKAHGVPHGINRAIRFYRGLDDK